MKKKAKYFLTRFVSIETAAISYLMALTKVKPLVQMQ